MPRIGHTGQIGLFEASRLTLLDKLAQAKKVSSPQFCFPAWDAPPQFLAACLEDGFSCLAHEGGFEVMGAQEAIRERSLRRTWSVGQQRLSGDS